MSVARRQLLNVDDGRVKHNDPPLLVADEPTGNLDARTADAILDLFARLSAEGKSVVMVTHERDVQRVVTRVITLDDGKVIPEATTRLLLPSTNSEEATYA